MLFVQVEHIGDTAIVSCKGRIVRSDAAYRLRKAVTSLTESRAVVLDLTEVRAIEGGGLGMLQFLERWAQEHRIQLKLFAPGESVKARLEQIDSTKFDIATFEEMTALLAHAGPEYEYGVVA